MMDFRWVGPTKVGPVKGPVTAGILAHLLRMVMEPKDYAFRRWLNIPIIIIWEYDNWCLGLEAGAKITPLISGWNKSSENHLFSAIYRGEITPFVIYNDCRGPPCMMQDFFHQQYDELPIWRFFVEYFGWHREISWKILTSHSCTILGDHAVKTKNLVTKLQYTDWL